MLSQHKLFIRFVETVAQAAILLAGGVATCAHFRPDSLFPFELTVFGLFAILMPSFGTACALGGEFVKTVRRATTVREKSDDLSPAEIGKLLRWAPVWQKAAAIAGILVAVVTGVTVGDVSWTSEVPFTPAHALGESLYLSAFYLLSLPVLGSASRMRGTYADNWVQ
jgi:hypothetical protein